MDDTSVSCRLILVFLMLLLLIIISPIVQSQRIELGSTLVAGYSKSASWISPNRDFTFGFQEVATECYLLAIAFNKLTNKTIVWSANRGNPVEKGSKVELSASAGLVLSDPTGKHLWATYNLSATADVDCGAILDTGNFVLLQKTTKNSTHLWQSFDYPTDTLLPGQVLNRNGSLLSSFSESNYSIGRFKLAMQADGNLVMYPLNYPKSDQVYTAYWATDTYTTQPSLDSTGFQFVFNESGRIYLIARNGTILYDFNPEPNSTAKKYNYMRLTLDPDGVLRLYYMKSSEATAWSVGPFQPTNICLRVGGTRGGGACGLNSVCQLATNQRPKCSCPKGYSLVDPTDSRSGCKPDFARQGCGNFTGGFMMHDVDNYDWPNSEYDYFEGVEKEWCGQFCLDDCFCEAAVFRKGACWKMGSPLRNGRVDPSKGGKALIKISNKYATAV